MQFLIGLSYWIYFSFVFLDILIQRTFRPWTFLLSRLRYRTVDLTRPRLFTAISLGGVWALGWGNNPNPGKYPVTSLAPRSPRRL